MPLSRRSRRAWVRFARVLAGCAGFALAVTTFAGLAEARSVTARGTEMAGFGRILLEFDQPTKVKVQRSGGIVILSFSDPAKLRAERLARELPSYIGVVRQDPDGLGLRLALTRAVRPNLLEAGEKVFVDLLPPNWVGLPPALPPEVVNELAQRANQADAQSRVETRRRRSEPVRSVGVRVVPMPTLTLTRILFDAPPATPVSFKAAGLAAELLFEAPLKLDAGDAREKLAPAVRALTAHVAEDSLRIELSLEEGYEARGFREEGAFIVDVAPTHPVEAPVEVKAVEAKGVEAKPEAQTPPSLPPVPVAPEPPSRPSPFKAAGPVEPGPAAPVRPIATAGPEGLRIVFPFGRPTAAAAYERGGILSIVFHTPDPVQPIALPAAAEPFAEYRETRRIGPLAVARFALKAPHVARLSPDSQGWAVVVGDAESSPTLPVSAAPARDEASRPVLKVALAQASGVHWIENRESGEHTAVVTAFGPARGVPKLQRFAELRVLPTAHGLAVVADADDVVVRSGFDEVTIARAEGLNITAPSFGDAAAQRVSPALPRERWEADRRGSALERLRAAMLAAAEAPRAARSKTRLDLARALMANGLNHEAASVVATALKEDQALARDRAALLLGGIAAARIGRPAEAGRSLGADHVKDDPEAVLWRAMIDAHARRWPQALAGLRRSGAVIESYPDELQAEVRIAGARAAIESGDSAEAERQLQAAILLPLAPAQRDEADLLKARIDEAGGRNEAALEEYRRIAEFGARPLAAEARLRWASLAMAERAMSPQEGVEQLERLAVVWRGDGIEAATLGRLGRLYAEMGRWRDAFSVASRANRTFTDHEVTRALHEETGRLFESLFLSGRGESLSRLDSLALYFDFKEFTPPGRRGDEIVRRLADRLVEVDLLDAAGDLLQHQVEKRLTGAARATVAARLATIRLMDEKPQQALAALQGTRLAELPAAMKRARLLLEARALSDLSRTDLALEILAGETGPEIERLTSDILWSARRWREAGEAHERMVGLRWRGPEALSDQDRRDVLRAAIAYSLAGETIALDRLRTKFAAKMADSADARTFAFVTRPNVASTQAFRDLARGSAEADTLADFLAEYRKRYPEAAAAARGRPAAPDGKKPQAETPEPPSSRT